jgi:hypothetical protein
MKKLLVVLSALTVCLGLSIDARHNDCNSCNTGCKTNCKRECKPCVKTCAPCKKECKAERVACPRPCPYQEEQIVEVVVPCPRYVKVIDYKIDKVRQVREICPPTEAVVGKWTCCDHDAQCGRCSACNSRGVEIDQETGILTNHPLYREAKNDPELAEKLKTAGDYNRARGVQSEGTVEAFGGMDGQDKVTHELGSSDYGFYDNAALNNNNEYKNTENKAMNKKEKAQARKKAKADKKAAKNNGNNIEIVGEELEIAAA